MFFFYLSGHPDIFILENNYFIKIKKMLPRHVLAARGSTRVK
jgi:hypothetical protein